jgi:energy-coupling factor transport system ATP-binding protein
VKEDCQYGPKNLGLPKEEIERRVNEALESVDLLSFKDEHPFFLGKGQRQRLAVASILTMHPDILIVDEPTTGQDMKQSEAMMKLVDKLNSAGTTVIIITHNMRVVAEHAERVIALWDGKIAMDGSTAQVFSKPEILKKNFLSPPQITQLAQSFQNYGFNPGILSVEEMVEQYNRLRV